MEEVDSILVHALQRLGCNVTSNLADLTTPQIVACVSCCLGHIKPELQLPPYEEKASMSARFKTCTELAEALIDIGYKDEIGCQSFLYPSEDETRKILIFVVEKLPRDVESTVGDEIQQITSKLSAKKLLDDSSVVEPSSEIKFPVAIDVNAFPKETLRFYASHLAELSFAQARMKFKEETPQTAGVESKLTESDDDDWATNADHGEAEAEPVTAAKPEVKPKPSVAAKPLVEKPVIKEKPKVAPKPDKKSVHEEEIEREQIQLHEEINAVHERVASKAQRVKQQEDALKNLMAKLRDGDADRLKRQIEEKSRSLSRFQKTQELLHGSEEGLEKVKNAIDLQVEKLLTLANQWEQHRQPLIEEFRKKRSENALKLTESTKLKEEIRTYKSTLKQMGQEAKAKSELHAQLVQELERMPKDLNRSSYTKRICEIIQNIKKQKREIAKVIIDTKETQKEINTLSGRLDRTFAVADELIFKDAEKDKAIAHSYRLLVQIHSDFSRIVKNLEEIGNMKRTRRDLEDKIEVEKAKSFEGKLERLRADLIQMKNENRMLQVKLQDHAAAKSAVPV